MNHENEIEAGEQSPASSVPAEEWREIPGYDGFYDVSSSGQVRSWKRRGAGAKVRAVKPKLVSSYTSGKTRFITLSLNGATQLRRVRDLIFESFIGPIPGWGEITGDSLSDLRVREKSLEQPLTLPSERWCFISGTSGTYEVSDFGRVRSWARGEPRILAQSGNTAGYPCVSMDRNGIRRSAWEVYRLVMEAFVGPLPEGGVTRHLNGDRSDSRLANLTYGTVLENAKDRVDHGMAARVLTQEDVTSLRLGVETPRQVSERTGAHVVTCTKARNGDRWIHLTDPPPWPKAGSMARLDRRGRSPN